MRIMAITCPQCGAEFDATLFEFEHRVRCACGADIHYPGTDCRSGHVAAARSSGIERMTHGAKDHVRITDGSLGEGGAKDSS
jgi:hypothetical protein